MLFIRRVLQALAVSVGFAALALGCDSPTEPTPPESCTYTLSATSFTFGAPGGTATVGIATDSGCAWTAHANVSWVSITSAASGTGPATVTFAAAANPETSERNGTLTIADQPVTVAQEAKSVVVCTYEVDPLLSSFDKNGGTGHLNMTAPADCAWTAKASASWITITGGDHGSGNGVIDYTVARNDDPASRGGTIVASGNTVAIAQSGNLDVCLYNVTPARFTPCMHVPFEMTSSIETSPSCPWTAAPDASWIAMTRGGSGSGTGVVGFTVTDSYDDPRSGLVMVRWPAPTAGQNLQVVQAGCRYAVSATSLAFTAAGGSGNVDVFQQSDPLECGGPLQNGCAWSATSTVAWIRVTTTMPKIGDDRFSFSLDANSSAAARSGEVVVRNKTVQITQAGTGMSLAVQLAGWAREHVQPRAR